MLSDIVINGSTTAESLFDEVYAENTSGFNEVYAALIGEYPDHEAMIRESWLKSNVFQMSYSEFKRYIFESTQEDTIFSGDFDY